MRSSPTQSSIFDVLDAPKVEKPQPERIQVQAPPIEAPEPKPTPKPRKAKKPKAKSKAEREAEAAEKAAIEKEKARQRSLASKKFDCEDIINADPMCRGAELKVFCAYRRFITDFENGTAFMSILDLRIATGLSNKTIIKARNNLIRLGYFIPAGTTRDGVEVFKVALKRENIVLDHIAISGETLRRLDKERQEAQRQKRKVPDCEDSTQSPTQPDYEESTQPDATENGGAKVDHGSGGIVLLRAA